MKQRHVGARLWGSLVGCLVVCLSLAPTAWEMSGSIPNTIPMATTDKAKKIALARPEPANSAAP